MSSLTLGHEKRGDIILTFPSAAHAVNGLFFFFFFPFIFSVLIQVVENEQYARVRGRLGHGRSYLSADKNQCVRDHVALRPQKRGCLLGTGTG